MCVLLLFNFDPTRHPGKTSLYIYDSQHFTLPYSDMETDPLTVRCCFTKNIYIDEYRCHVCVRFMSFVYKSSDFLTHEKNTTIAVLCFLVDFSFLFVVL